MKGSLFLVSKYCLFTHINKKMALHEIITFVFSDIEHSTRLAQQLKEAYAETLDQHRSVIREAISKFEGREIDTAGDGFFMTFKNTRSALLAASEIQQAFHTQPWATSIGLKVRMGIHTGVGLLTKTGYTGVEVHMASRVCNAAFGGQVLISGAANECLEEALPESLSVSRLGVYKLKDFTESVALFQLNISGIKKRFTKPRINPDEKKIAVLPFVNRSKEVDDEYLGNGMAEELIVALGKVQGLRVVSRSSSFLIKEDDRNPRHVGKKLDVSSMLEGRIKTSKRHLVISVELIDTKSGLNIWSEHFNSSKQDLIHIQDRITRKVADALNCKLEPEQRDSIQHRQTHNAEAYDFYLRGRRFYLQFSSRGIDLALQMFEKAIEADSTYALAYAGMADCYSYQFQHKAPLKEIIDKADEASQKAIELAPGLAEVYVSRGIVKALRKQFDLAEKSFNYAIEQDPTLFLGWFHYARSCFAMGKFDLASRLFEQANRVEPDDYQSILLAAQVYDDNNCHDLAQIMRLRGVANAEKCLELNPADTRALYLGANALALLGQRKKSLSFLTRALTLDPDDSMLLYNAGCVYALLGMKQEALSCLEKAYQAGLTLVGWYENDSNIDSLRNHPRFIKLLEEIKNATKL
jgi:TolB-like protein/Tfp pilus assembly protein PilF